MLIVTPDYLKSIPPSELHLVTGPGIKNGSLGGSGAPWKPIASNPTEV